MQMRVHEARHQDQPGEIAPRPCMIGPDRGDRVADDGDVAPEHLARHHVEDARAPEHQIGGRIAARDLDEPRQRRHQKARKVRVVRLRSMPSTVSSLSLMNLPTSASSGM